MWRIKDYFQSLTLPQKAGVRVKPILQYYPTMLLHSDGNFAIAPFSLVKSNVHGG